MKNRRPWPRRDHQQPRSEHPRKPGSIQHGGRDRTPPHEHGGHRPAEGQIIFGVEPVRELVAVSPKTVRTLYVKAGAGERFTEEIAAVREAGGHIVTAEDHVLSRMAGSGSRHQGIVAAIREFGYVPLEQLLEDKPDPLVVVDGVTDPRNLGAVMRSAECAGARAIVLARDRTAAVTSAAVKASAGAWVHMKIAQCGNVAQTLEAFKAQGYWIAALAPDGDHSIYELDVTRKLALVLGSEDQGIRELIRKTADFRVRIPMYGRVASLNVSVAAAVALFELARRRERPVPERGPED